MTARWFALVPAVALTAACTIGPSPSPSSTASPAAPSPSTSVAAPGPVVPAEIRRLAGEFPPGYERGELAGPGAPVGYWGVRAGWESTPPECASYAAPVGVDTPHDGLSGSGPGGIIYAAISTAPAPLEVPSTLDACGRFTVTAGRTTADVELTGGPFVDRVATFAMTTAIRSVVEGGTETSSQAHTATAYLGEHLVFVVVVTDPGSPNPPLAAEEASNLLVKAVALLRG